MNIVYVDGFKIRQTLDTDFSIVHKRGIDPTDFAAKFYIPKGIYWFDKQFKKETKYLMQVETYAFKNESQLKKKFADNPYIDKQRWYRIEKFTKKEKTPAFLKKEERHNGITVKFVDGSIIRKYLDPEFVFGGHGMVYSYIAKNEIWIDHLARQQELAHILVHEMTEYLIMREEKRSYDIAHEYANAKERESRRKAGGVYPGDKNYPAKWTMNFLINKYYANF